MDDKPSTGDCLPLLPEGEYTLKLESHHCAIFFKSPRLVLTFSVADFGEHFGAKLSRYYNVSSIKGKPGAHSNVKHKHSGDFMIEFYTLFPDQPRRRLDRIPMEPFYKASIIGRIRNVKRNNQQKKLPEQLQHSVIAELLRAET